MTPWVVKRRYPDGGSNADTFKISKGNDVIRDFSIVQNDRIEANGYTLKFIKLEAAF